MRMVDDARMVIVPMFRIGTKVNGFATVTLSGSPAWRVPWRAMHTVAVRPVLNSLEALFAPCCCSSGNRGARGTVDKRPPGVVIDSRPARGLVRDVVRLDPVEEDAAEAEEPGDDDHEDREDQRELGHRYAVLAPELQSSHRQPPPRGTPHDAAWFGSWNSRLIIGRTPALLKTCLDPQ